MKRALPFFLLLSLAACSFSERETPQQAAQPSYTRVNFTDLPGYGADRLAEALPALTASCKRLGAVPPDRSLGADGKMGRAADWRPFCTALAGAVDEAGLRQVLERHLQPWSVSAGNKPDGLFTGYYESTLHGSLTRQGPYQTPLYQRPSDLIMVDLGEFRDELKGQRIAGRNVSGQLKPYEDRAAIVGGRVTATPLVWLDDPVDAFFVQVQGSGRVQLEDGREMRVAYDGQNGHIYTAIGKELIARGALTSETVSLQTIRSWLEANPAEAGALMNTNRSYVFFRDAGTSSAGPTGSANVPLTPGRSLAVDNRYIGYHVPVWLDAENPQGGRMDRLVVAQDTGGAIKGIVRGDLFWGHGAQAEQAAGIMKSRGRYFVLLPQGLTP